MLLGCEGHQSVRRGPDESRVSDFGLCVTGAILLAEAESQLDVFVFARNPFLPRIHLCSSVK